MPYWKDISSYSQSDTDRTPRSWEIHLGKIRVVVTRMIRLEGWYLDASPFCHYRALTSSDIKQAKKEAIGYVLGDINDALDDAREAFVS